ncbi:hypothetical protein G6F57_011268 [Rhizopus arrhizus]|uniref:Uncharacterized protein n=1 Tax=Rhizopus oryzae TaxID=64495 RepID=A0A9P6X5E8_RHIOR|nr:hypothetical protein G6F30_011334 [Rhizopus arrhizus]KAG1411212.1 hypothetical protein G6F58_008682 [Rhizopus delemar]KAG0977793.1 hypothetical protein G6F29_009801 [Rhizopus arrhizus]KAG0982113.1 hypothetical protein G6F28_011264 [Rhizopus arrhizus]KAG1002955.1 hypothetical protein G6F27_011490 [Rhizopus arrhizus]
MYQDNEEEIELLRQYEDEDPSADKHKYFSDGMDSDLEDKIVSIVQYQAGVTKEPTDEHPDVSFLSKERENELVLADTMSTSSSDTEGLQITNYISLDKEDREQNLKIHELVDSIIKCFVLNATSPDTQIMTAVRVNDVAKLIPENVVIGQVTADGVKKMIILLLNVKIKSIIAIVGFVAKNVTQHHVATDSIIIISTKNQYSRHTVEQKRKKEKDSISHLGKHTYQDNEDDDSRSLSDDSTEVKSAISISSDSSSQDTNVKHRMDISKKRRGGATDDDDSDDDRELSYNKDKKLQSTSKRRKLDISDDAMTKRKPI